MRDDPENPRGYVIDCDGCGEQMRGSVDTVVTPYAVDVLTFSKHEYYCAKCWATMKRAVRRKTA